MGGAIPPLPNTPSWRRTQLKKAQGHLYLVRYWPFAEGLELETIWT